jgi:hypothetical protein
MLNFVKLYDQFSSVDLFLPKLKEQRDHVPKIKNYFEETIPAYSPDDFKSHFRMSREAFTETTCVLSNLDQFNKAKGPSANVDKNLLMFLWYIGKVLQIFTNSCFIEDDRNILQSTFHLNIHGINL